MQTNPEGFAQLLKSVKARQSSGEFLEGVFSKGEISRLVQAKVNLNRRTAAAKRGVATRQNRVSAPVFALVPIEPDALYNAGEMNFGTVLKDNPPPSQEFSTTAYGEGTASWSLTGSKGFSVKLVKTTDWISDGFNSTEQTVEHSGNKFPVKGGTTYRVYVQFNPKLVSGPQTGQLTIQEPKRTVVIPLKGDTFAKSLGVEIVSFTPGEATLMPNESFDVTVNMKVNQNSGSQLVFKPVTNLVGIKMDQASQWIANAGPNTQKLRIRTNRAALDGHTSLTIGVYPVNSGSPLTTFSIPISIQRQWLEYKYDLSAGKQKVWGKFQLANTGEYIWDCEFYNSSLIFSDKFMTAFVISGLGGPTNPGNFFRNKLPQGSTDRFYYRQTGVMPANDFKAMQNTVLKSYLGVDEGGTIASIGEGMQAFWDSLEESMGGETIPDNFSGKWKKWLTEQKLKRTKITDQDIWK
jgi:hypothetical protein